MAVFLWLVVPVFGQQPSASEIVDRAVARALRQRLAGAETAVRAVIQASTEFLDGEGRVRKTERLRYRRYPLEGVVFEELIARDGKPLEGTDATAEIRRKEEFAREVRRRRARGEAPVPEDQNSVEFNREFVSRYRFTVVGEETLGLHSCWILDFAPRQGDLPVRRRIDHALNNSTGKIWIDQVDYGVSRVEFEMARAVRFWGGLLGTLNNTVGRLQFTRVDTDVWLPTSIDIELDLRILFRNIRRRIQREWVESVPRSGERTEKGTR